MRDYVPIQKDLIPYEFNILLGGQWFQLYVDYNETGDIFTLAVKKDNELLTVEPLVLDVPLFRDTYQPGFPVVELVPQAPGGGEAALTWDNLGETVFLTVNDESGGSDG